MSDCPDSLRQPTPPGAMGAADKPDSWTWTYRIALIALPIVLAVGAYYRPVILGDSSWLGLRGDGRFYAYQLAHAGELHGRWWKLAEDEQVGAPYPTGSAKHPGIFEGVDLILLSSLTSRFLDPIHNYHFLVLLVIASNGWVASWFTLRLTRSPFWAGIACVLITVNVSTGYRFGQEPHLLKFGWILIAVMGFWRYLEAPTWRRGTWLGVASALVLQSSFYLGYFLGLLLLVCWLGILVAGKLNRRHVTAAVTAGISFFLVAAALLFPVWRMLRANPLAQQNYGQRDRAELWPMGSELWNYVVSPTWSYAERFQTVLHRGHFDFLETWHYPGFVALLGLGILGVLLFRRSRRLGSHASLLRLLWGVVLLAVVLSLPGEPGLMLFDLVPSFRCYGRAGIIALAILSLLSPLAWHHALQGVRSAGWRRTLQFAVLLVAFVEAESIARWVKQPPAYQEHWSWVPWLAQQPTDVRVAVFPDSAPGQPHWDIIWHWNALYERLTHRHACLYGCESTFLEADLKRFGASYEKMNESALQYVEALGYHTFIFDEGYLSKQTWIADTPWLRPVIQLDGWRVFEVHRTERAVVAHGTANP